MRDVFWQRGKHQVAVEGDSGTILSGRLNYTREVEAILAQKKTKLEHVKEKIEYAVIAGRITVSEPLRNAERQADCHLATAQAQFEHLKSANDDQWEALRAVVDAACEDLSQSIKMIVARFG